MDRSRWPILIESTLPNVGTQVLDCVLENFTHLEQYSGCHANVLALCNFLGKGHPELRIALFEVLRGVNKAICQGSFFVRARSYSNATALNTQGGFPNDIVTTTNFDFVVDDFRLAETK
jgi:hypothetical protein